MQEKNGTALIYKKFQEFLKQNNVKEIEAQHADFDVDLHEAITKIPAPSEELKGKVVDVIQKGYCLNEKGNPVCQSCNRRIINSEEEEWQKEIITKY